MNTARKTLAVFYTQHQREEGKVVETGEAGIKTGFERDDGHSSEGEGEIEDYHRRQQEEEQREQDCPEQKLVEVVIAVIDSIAQHISLLPAE